MTKAERTKQRRKGCLRWLLLLFLLALGAAVACFIIGLSVIKHFSKGLPDVGALKGYEPSQTTRIHASTGELIATLFKENRTYTKVEDMAPAMLDAIVAIEDSRFREHIGVDPRGVIRAAVYDIQHRGAHQGASTITMQLARNLFLTPTRSIERKIREVLLSLEIEKRFTKDEILELYLNQIYFGSGAYGIASASKLYFDKPPSELSIAEASLLAGLPQAPSSFSPFVDERAAKMRQIFVLGRMRDTNAISQREYRDALDETKKFVFDKERDEVEYEILKYPYFTTYALRALSKTYSEELMYRGGLTIHTTIDIGLQTKCQKILSRMIATDGRKLGADTGAIVLIENKTGYIRALVGGTGWSQESQFNRSWQARRQPGSTFKPLVYAAALEQGWTPESKIEDKAFTINLAAGEVWKPRNSDKTYMGEITLATALKYSRNVAAARLGQKIGLDSVIKLARKAGITEQLPPHPSLALGSVEITPLEMAAAYTIFPNDGIAVEAVAVKRVVDGTGDAVEENTFANKRDVLSSKTAQSMVKMMRGVVEEGTATNAILDKHQAAGKTGTTDSFRDAWFIGFTADYTAAVWVGKDDNSQMKKSYGGDLPARIWKQVMSVALKDRPPTQFFLDRLDRPQTASGSSSASGNSNGDEETPMVPMEVQPQVILTVCKETRLRAQPGCPAIVKVNVVAAGDVDWCPRHSQENDIADDWSRREPVATAPPDDFYGDQGRSSTKRRRIPTRLNPNPGVNDTQYRRPITNHQQQQNPTADNYPNRMESQGNRRHREGSVRSMDSVNGMEAVESMTRPRRGRRAGGFSDEESF